jgi:hypothetical protein
MLTAGADGKYLYDSYLDLYIISGGLLQAAAPPLLRNAQSKRVFSFLRLCVFVYSTFDRLFLEQEKNTREMKVFTSVTKTVFRKNENRHSGDENRHLSDETCHVRDDFHYSRDKFYHIRDEVGYLRDGFYHASNGFYHVSDDFRHQRDDFYYVSDGNNHLRDGFENAHDNLPH